MPDFREFAVSKLRYEPETGHFYWLKRTNGNIPESLRAGSLLQGYVMINVGERIFRAHRLAWLFITGSFPEKGYEIDHINANRADNRWENLRLVTRSQNNMNRGVQSNSKSGCAGVAFASRRGIWTARLTLNGKVMCLGEFALMEDAIRARKAAEAEYFGEHRPKESRTAVPKGTGPIGSIRQVEA